MNTKDQEKLKERFQEVMGSFDYEKGCPKIEIVDGSGKALTPSGPQDAILFQKAAFAIESLKWGLSKKDLRADEVEALSYILGDAWETNLSFKLEEE